LTTVRPDQTTSSSQYVITASGIDTEPFDMIFKMFKRMHPRDAFGGGTDAGLAIVRKLLERMGGSIRLESAVGVGTTFFLSLPKS
jgi:chemotaxis family two-component system sensor kinase Cph1